MRPEDFGVWARYALSASDLRGMIERAVRTLDYFESVSEFRLDISAELARWSYTMHEPGAFGHRHVADRALQPMLTAMRYYLGPGWTPTLVEFDYERPLHWRKLEELFRAPIMFNCSTNALVFPSRLLDQPSVRDPDVTVGQMVAAATAKTGENVAVSRFVRFKLGETAE